MVERDGGYYAIKGFTYQFDKSLLEVLKNKQKDIQIEQVQDVGIDDYYIQVKYKETQKYTHSKIRPAITQLLDCHIADRTRGFSLYCYFKDKSSQKLFLTEDLLDEILGNTKDSYTQDDKKSFIENFTLEFSENFEKQFKNLIKEIVGSFDLKNDEEATAYHSILRAKLLDTALNKKVKSRVINFQILKTYAAKNERVLFELAHYKYLKNERYLKYLKKEYFTFKKINIPTKERLFAIELDDSIKDSDILQIVTNIKSRYFKKDISPAPYICLMNIKADTVRLLKQKLWDKGLFFADGTHFSGDRFRIVDLISDTHTNHSTATFKLVSLEDLTTLFKKKKIDEVFVFQISHNRKWQNKLIQANEFYVSRTRDILKVIY